MIKKGDKITSGNGDFFNSISIISKDKKYEVVRTDDYFFYIICDIGSEYAFLIERLSNKCRYYDEYLLRNIVGERREKLNKLNESII
jgi:hypothetical protein